MARPVDRSLGGLHDALAALHLGERLRVVAGGYVLEGAFISASPRELALRTERGTERVEAAFVDLVAVPAAHATAGAIVGAAVGATVAAGAALRFDRSGAWAALLAGALCGGAAGLALSLVRRRWRPIYLGATESAQAPLEIQSAA